ncbi:hypothetical protein ACFWBH_01090 [Streptomyces sp. NPDC059999]|uniref:hypothetical protein n=1 Tax=Streptomyces sp. NPDC059999 TaxID=3347030 RepID=UPI0036AE2139
MEAPNGLKARNARLILAAAVVAVALLLVGGGFAVATLMHDDAGSPPPAAGGPSAGTPTPKTSTGGAGPVTPETGSKVKLDKPTGQKDGVSTGFRNSPMGAISAVAHFWEEYAWLDDEKASQQLTAVASKDSPGYVDKHVSEVRAMREGVGLPPSGGIPADINFTTSVTAVRVTSVKAPGVPLGDVMQIWVAYDRFATGPNGGRDENPLRDEMTDFIVKWQDGAWKFTDEYIDKRSFPRSYEATSPYARADGWTQVVHAN